MDSCRADGPSAGKEGCAKRRRALETPVFGQFADRLRAGWDPMPVRGLPAYPAEGVAFER
jgi:hypothetical protein